MYGHKSSIVLEAVKINNMWKKGIDGVRIKDYFLIISGCILTALSINIFMVPYKIAPGGVTGLATVIYYVSGSRLPVGTIMLILNIPLFVGGMRYIGKKFAARTLFSTILLSLAIDASQPFTDVFVDKYLGSFEDVSKGSNLLLYCIFGGAIMGAGLGLVFRAGATTGGTDLAARIVNHFIPYVSIGKILMFIDAAVVIFASVSFDSFLLGMYAIVTIFIASKVIDALLEGVDFAKALFIISDKPEEISSRLLKDLDRGVTALDGKGKYTGMPKEVLICVLARTQVPQAKAIVKQIDPKAFVFMTDVREVLGEGFKSIV